MKKWLFSLLVGAMLVSGVQTAQASVLSWGISDMSYGFTSWTSDSVDGTSGIYSAKEETSISWGPEDVLLGSFVAVDNSDLRSHLTLTDTGAQSITTGEKLSLFNLEHINNLHNMAVLKEHDFLTGASISMSFTLTAEGSDISIPVEFSFDFSFEDTTEFPLMNTMRDDTLTITALNSVYTFGEYTVTLDSLLGNLEEGLVWSSAEDATTSLGFTVSVTHNAAPTPEPATMLLMGLGLAGLGFAVRRNKK